MKGGGKCRGKRPRQTTCLAGQPCLSECPLFIRSASTYGNSSGPSLTDATGVSALQDKEVGGEAEGLGSRKRGDQASEGMKGRPAMAFSSPLQTSRERFLRVPV